MGKKIKIMREKEKVHLDLRGKERKKIRKEKRNIDL
jgi:hypothetical protein